MAYVGGALGEVRREVNSLEQLAKNHEKLYEADISNIALSRSRGFRRHLQNLLGTITDYGFAGAIIYFPHFEDKKLHFYEGIGDKLDSKELQESGIQLSYKFPADNEGPFASHVFWSKTELIENADTSPHFDKELRDHVGVFGTAVGIPLRLFARCFGVLICWGPHDVINQELIKSAKMHASLIAAALASAQARRRKFGIAKYVSKIVRLTSKSLEQATLFEHVVNACLILGFSRVRIFTYDQASESFSWVHAGSNSPQDDKFDAAVRIRSGNPYLQHVLSKSKTAILSSPNYKTTQFIDAESNVPEIFSFLFNDELFGPDEDSSLVGRDRGVPWAITPMVFNGVCVGYITVDNQGIGSAIDSESMFHLGFLGFLSAACLTQVPDKGKLIEQTMEKYVSFSMVDEPVRERSPRYHQHLHQVPFVRQYSLLEEDVEQTFLTDLNNTNYLYNVANGMRYESFLRDVFNGVGPRINRISEQDSEEYNSDCQQWGVTLPSEAIKRICMYARSELTVGQSFVEEFNSPVTSISVRVSLPNTLIFKVRNDIAESTLEYLEENIERFNGELMEVLDDERFDELLMHSGFQRANERRTELDQSMDIAS